MLFILLRTISTMSCWNNQGGNNENGDDNNSNRCPSPEQPKDDTSNENNTSEESASYECGSQNQSLGGFLSQIMGSRAGGDSSNHFHTNARRVPRNLEGQRRLLVSILEDAVRICNDEDVPPSTRTNSRRTSSSSSQSNTKKIISTTSALICSETSDTVTQYN